MWPLYSAALIAGLVGSPHCMGMCGAFATASSGSVRQLGSYHLGRLSTYAGLGGAAGALGSALPGPGWVPSVAATVLLVWFSARLAGLLPESHFGSALLTRLSSRFASGDATSSRVIFGALTGLLPCGLTWTALAIPVAMGSALHGALAMVVFGLGTVPLLSAAGYGLRRLTARSLWARRGLAAVVLASGLWSLVLRAPINQTGDEPSCCASGEEHEDVADRP